MHESAERGYRTRADTYQDARPTYHPALVDRFVSRYGRGRVAELGAGTGIFTAQLVEAGVDVVAIEPVAEMRAHLAARAPGAVVLDGTAESVPLEDQSVRTVVAAQSFHWFNAARALEEVARVLRPAGFLVTVWNVRDETASWAKAYTEIIQRYEGNTPRHRSMLWRTAIDADPRLELVEDWAVDNPYPTTVDGVVSRALSTSFIAALEPSEQDRVAAAIAELVQPHGPDLDFPYRSELQAWRVI